MFQESLVESTPLLRSRNRWPALISFATQAVAAAMLVAIPILHPEVLPAGAIKLSHLDPPPLPHREPPPSPHAAPTTATVAPTAAPALAARVTRPAILSEAPPVDTPLLPFGSANGTTNPLSALGNVGDTGPNVVASAPSVTAHALLNISTGVSAGMLLAPIQPLYPQMARLTRTEGTVVVQAIISRTGAIETARIISGPPMLQAAALNAVRAARYRPYLLNGQPTEVETTISINFRMGS